MNNQSLCILIKGALTSPEQAEALALAIDQLPEVRAYIGQGLQPYYTEALLATQRDIQRNIRKFPQKYRLDLETLDHKNDSETAQLKKYFINWVVMILRRDCYDVIRRKIPRILSLDEIIGESNSTRGDKFVDETLSGLDNLIEDEEKMIFCSRLRNYIEIDPDQKLRNCHVRDRPEINCQTLLQLRFLGEPPLTLKEISEKLQSPLQTIKSRLERNCMPLIKETAIEFGYT